ncbi:hypothetical protein [Paenibacillus sp. FSL H8-0537]|uniref:hypothetical protein n=1 Tax=Paenibacillus sp. FSL H8-0537 TaxID=2921399 RepID=UPI0031012183
MAKKGQVFQQYAEAFKLVAVQLYVEGSESYLIPSRLGYEMNKDRHAYWAVGSNR